MRRNGVKISPRKRRAKTIFGPVPSVRRAPQGGEPAQTAKNASDQVIIVVLQ